MRILIYLNVPLLSTGDLDDESEQGPDGGIWSSVAALLISIPALVGS